MWHEKAAAGNIFRQPQIILHVCARTLTSGQEVEATTKTGEGSWGEGEREGRLEWEPVGVELGYYNICLFVDIKTQFMQRHYYQTLLTFESRLQATPPPPFFYPTSCLAVCATCNNVDFYAAALVVCHRQKDWRLQFAASMRRSLLDFNDARISFNDVLSQVQWKTERFKIERREK